MVDLHDLVLLYNSEEYVNKQIMLSKYITNTCGSIIQLRLYLEKKHKSIETKRIELTKISGLISGCISNLHTGTKFMHL